MLKCKFYYRGALEGLADAKMTKDTAKLNLLLESMSTTLSIDQGRTMLNLLISMILKAAIANQETR